MEITSLDITGEMIVATKEMHKVVAQAKRFAPYNRPVILMGETGTGKEELAKLIHTASGRKGLLISINPASVSEHLIESELFGHGKGAFTGADRERKGLLELADQGTVFFDEIAEMSLSFQAKLLRILDGCGSHLFLRVGESHEIMSNFRVICASNRPLEELVDEGKFLKDLFYRLQVFRLNLPPLRERTEDIVVLMRYYMEKTCIEFGKELFSISREAWNALIDYAWPGNIRELKTIVDRAVALYGNDISELNPGHLNLVSGNKAAAAPSEKLSESELKELLNLQIKSCVAEFLKTPDAPCPEKISPRARKSREQLLSWKGEYIQALQESGWNRTKAAKILGLPYQTFYKRICILRIMPPEGRWKVRA